jgi:hypothetical protein
MGLDVVAYVQASKKEANKCDAKRSFVQVITTLGPSSGRTGDLGEWNLGIRRRLDRTANAEFADAGLKRGALHAEEEGRAFGAGDAPLRLLQRAEDVLALGFFEGGD